MEDSKRRLSIIVSEQANKFEEEQKRLLKALSKLSEDENDTGMAEHLENVSYNARLLAHALNFADKYENDISKFFIDAVELSGMVHDIGKLKVPKEILKKNDKLTPMEWEMVKHHTDGGYTIEEVKEYMHKDRGIKFDPYILDIFFKIEKQLRKPSL